MAWKSVLLIVCVAACGDDAGTPSTSKLRGWWSFEDAATQTVFGFVPADEIATTVDTEGVSVPPGADLAVVYTGSAYSEGLELLQMSTYEVVDGTLVQTVLADVASPPGTQYGTDIIELDDTHLTLESTNDPSGMRTYAYSSRCPNENNVGWALAGFGDPSDPTKHDPALAIDAKGHVHALLGSAGGATYSVFGNGCRPIIEPALGARKQAIALVGDEVHALFELINDGSVVHRWRTAPGAPWQVEPVIPPTTTTFLYQLKLFVDGDDLIALASRTDGSLLIYRRDGSGWSSVPVVVPDPQRRAEDATIGGTGEIVIWTSDRVRRIRGTAVEDIPPPIPGGTAGSVRVDAMGRIHAAWEHTVISSAGSFGGMRSAYGIYDGTWVVHQLGPMMFPRVVTTPEGPLRVIGTELRNDTLTLTEIADDGSLTSELLMDGGVTPGVFTAGTAVDAVAAPDGTIAASFSSKFVQVRFPKRLRPARTATLTLRFGLGAGRAYTDDGAIDCTATCTKQVPLGTRYQLRLDPAIAGYQRNLSTCLYADAYSVDGWCWANMIGPTPLKPVELSVNFYAP
jgi:hypothetical protein